MQQRRGTSEQWDLANPVLSAGEIGFETDTSQFKIGDGVTTWEDLSYFANLLGIEENLEGYVSVDVLGEPLGVATLDEAGQVPFSQLGNIVDGAPGVLNTLNELAAAIGDDANFLTTISTSIATKQDKVANVSDTEIGYLDGVTSAIQTQLDSKLASANLSEAAQDAVNTALVAGTGIDKTYDDASNTITLDIDSTVATKTYVDTAVGNVDLSTKQDVVSGVSSTEIGYLDGVTSAIQTQINSKAPTVDPTFTGTVSGVTKTHVGLGNVDNTSDANKPVSTATQTALDAKASNTDLSTHASDTTDVHGIADTSLLATKSYADNAASAAAAAVVDSAPGALNTLNELAAALGDDANFATSTASLIGEKVAKSGDTMTGDLTLSGAPTSDLHAATKKYVDDEISGIDLSAKQDVVSGVSSTEIGYLDGVTSSIQAQLNSKASASIHQFAMIG